MQPPSAAFTSVPALPPLRVLRPPQAPRPPRCALRRRDSSASDANAAAAAAAAVQLANHSFYNALRNADAAAMHALWLQSDGVSCAVSMAPLVVGWTPVMHLWQQLFLSGAPQHVSVRVLHLHLRRNVAWLLCEQTVRAERALKPLRGVRVATNVFQCRRGRWLLVHHHASPLDAAAD